MDIMLKSDCWVSLTPEGEALHEAFLQELEKRAPLPMKFVVQKDADGRSRIPLWEVMEVFGKGIVKQQKRFFATEVIHIPERSE